MKTIFNTIKENHPSLTKKVINYLCKMNDFEPTALVREVSKSHHHWYEVDDIDGNIVKLHVIFFSDELKIDIEHAKLNA